LPSFIFLIKLLMASAPTPLFRFWGRLPFEALLVSGLVFLVMGLIAALPWSFKAFDPVKEVLRDFSYTDVYYSKVSREASVDTSIVLVNIGSSDRATLAALVRAVGAAQPRVIGIDAYFTAWAPDSGTAQLAAALRQQRHRLVTAEYVYEAAAGPARLVGSAPALAPGRRGYVNFVGNDSLDGTVREFSPFRRVQGRELRSWSAQILALASPPAFATLRARHRATETIRYSGNLSRFVAFEGAAVASGAVPPEALRHKMVLLGFLGEPLGTRSYLEDLHFTPLNARQVGRSLPDMYGLVIQANILSMMLRGSYITPVPQWLELLVAFGVCYCLLLVFMYLNMRRPLWYHPLSVVVQFGSGALLVYLAIELYVRAHLELGVALAVLAAVLSLKVLSLYGTLASWAYRKWGVRSYMVRA